MICKISDSLKTEIGYNNEIFSIYEDIINNLSMNIINYPSNEITKMMTIDHDSELSDIKMHIYNIISYFMNSNCDTIVTDRIKIIFQITNNIFNNISSILKYNEDGFIIFKYILGMDICLFNIIEQSKNNNEYITSYNKQIIKLGDQIEPLLKQIYSQLYARHIPWITKYNKSVILIKYRSQLINERDFLLKLNREDDRTHDSND